MLRSSKGAELAKAFQPLCAPLHFPSRPVACKGTSRLDLSTQKHFWVERAAPLLVQANRMWVFPGESEPERESTPAQPPGGFPSPSPASSFWKGKTGKNSRQRCCFLPACPRVIRPLSVSVCWATLAVSRGNEAFKDRAKNDHLKLSPWVQALTLMMLTLFQTFLEGLFWNCLNSLNHNFFFFWDP